MSDVLDEEGQSKHIEYFQGYGQFYERGLPRELPAAVKDSILKRPEMVAIQYRIQQRRIGRMVWNPSSMKSSNTGRLLFDSVSPSFNATRPSGSEKKGTGES